MAKHKIALIPGDGIGKEVLPEGVRVLEAAARRFNFQLEFTEYDWSCDRYAKTGRMMGVKMPLKLPLESPSLNRTR